MKWKKIALLLLIVSTIPVVAGNYYSQIGQDQYVNEHFFHNKKQGVFIDIGAHDGITFSNTYFFEKELGWTGICFEPIEELFIQLQKNRSCICINACVAALPGAVEFIEVYGYSQALSGMLATYHPLHLKRLQREVKQFGGSFTVKKCAACTLNAALAAQGITHVDFLSIDTEGSELEILRSIDFDTIAIDVITVENNYADPAIRSFLELHHFTFVTTLCAQDEIYVHHNFNKDSK